jgi:hypothetical protein
MNLLKNNLTFAILIKSGGWKVDLTTRFCEYFSHKINGQDFLTNIVYPSCVDDALQKCTTDYLLIQTDGHIPFSKDFFTVLNQAAEEASDIFLSHLSIENEYAELDRRCIFFNVKLWKEAGCPQFYSQVREGPNFKVLYLEDTKIPAQLTIDTSDRIFIDQSCSSSGAAIAIKQLELYGSVTSLAAVSPSDQTFFLDDSSPYKELYSETFFEKKYLPTILSKVFIIDEDIIGDIKNVSAKLIMAPAQGLKALSLAEYFKASTVMVYDSNPIAIELQKLIFSVTTATLYGDIISEFIGMYPDVNFYAGENWESDKFYVVQPLKNVKVSFHLIDAFSYEIDELIRTIDHSIPAIFDLSDIFVYPYNYYKRPMHQVQGLFAELYSLLKSRAGSTHILGYAPGFQNMDSIEVNTSTVSYSMDQYYIEPTDDNENLTQDLLDTDLETELEEHGLKVIGARLDVEEVAITKLEEQINSNFIPLAIVASPVELVKWTPPTVENVVALSEDIVYDVALNMGYVRSNRSEIENGSSINKTVLSYSQKFDEFVSTFEYTINPFTNEWKFTAGKEGGTKRVEFSNGQDKVGLLKHLNQPVKINPKTALKYF